MGVLDAVADPVRLRLVRHLAEHGSGTLNELSEAAGVHLNTIRVHVAALEEAGVLESEQQAASGPGRPASEYRLVDGWGLSSTDFLELAGLLAAALVRGHPDRTSLREAGVDWGRYLVGGPGGRGVVGGAPGRGRAGAAGARAARLPRHGRGRAGADHGLPVRGRLARSPRGRLRAGD